MQQPDGTAVNVALWRAAHMIVDDPPHVLEDRIGLELAYRGDIFRAAGYRVAQGAPTNSPGDDWLSDPRITEGMRRRWRASVVARARFIEDLVVSEGVKQYVILGAGLDSFALRRPELAARVRVFEVDQPDTQAWKQERIGELGFALPTSLSFAPVDFESGESWVDKIVAVGFDRAATTIVASTGVTQYITSKATREMMESVAGLGERTTLVCTFILPADLIDPVEFEMRAAAETGAASRGHPWISFFAPDEFLAIAREAGFETVRHVSADDLTRLYFAGRPDGLRPSTSEDLMVATH